MKPLTDKMARMLAALKAHPNASTMELIQYTSLASPRDWVRHLRDRGYRIDMTEAWVNGARVCRYRLIENPQGQLWEAVG